MLGLGQGLEPEPVLELGQGLALGLVLAPVLERVLAPVLALVPGSQWLTSSRPATMPAELTVFFSSPIYLLKDLKSQTTQPPHTFISTTPLLSKLTNTHKRVW